MGLKTSRAWFMKKQSQHTVVTLIIKIRTYITYILTYIEKPVCAYNRKNLNIQFHKNHHNNTMLAISKTKYSEYKFMIFICIFFYFFY